MKNFCPDAETEPKCYTVADIDFTSEENILDVLLDLLKSELPARVARIKDCEDNYMHISEDAIDILPPMMYSSLNVILNPLGEQPSYYDDGKRLRDVKYNFEAILTVSNPLARCVTWELIRFKNVVDGLILAAELYIDGYHSVYLEPTGFQWALPSQEDGVYRRKGAYRFSVTVTQSQNQ